MRRNRGLRSFAGASLEHPKNILITKILRVLTLHPGRGLARSRSLDPSGPSAAPNWGLPTIRPERMRSLSMI